MANALHLGLHPVGNDLHLGYEDSGDDRQAAIAATTGGARAAMAAGRIVFAAIAATTGGARGHCVLAYDPNLLSDVVGATEDRFRGGALCQAGALSGYRAARLEWLAGRAAWCEGPLATGPLVGHWRGAERATGGSQGAWREGPPCREGTVERWHGAALAVADGSDAWREGSPTEGGTRDTWMRGLPRPMREAVEWWRDGDHRHHPLAEDFGDGQWLPKSCDRNSWQDADWVGYVRRVPVPWSPPPRPWVPQGNTLHLCRLEGGNDLHLGYQCERRIPRRRSYRVQHQIAITRLSDATPIPTQTISLTLDADSWAWSWSATLLGPEALPLVLPSELGEPVTLSAVIDGHTWHLVVEDWQEDRQFGSRSTKVSGRGLSAWLGQPYEPAASGTMENARTLAQAMAEMLPLGGGWTLDWADGTPDWLLPSGSWNWSNQAPIQAIHAAAQAVGLVVVPALAEQTLTVQPRYPVLPWAFDAATPDLFVPDSAILSVSRRQAVPSQANAVYVYGESGGIIARVWRTGTAGDRLASSANAEQITHVDGARLLGERLLAAQAEQPVVRSFTIPLGGVFLLAQIGELVSLDLSGADVRGIVNSVAITASGNTVRQTVTIGEDTPNAWAMWRRLDPDAPLLLGAVIAIHEDATRTVEFIGGGRQRVRGEGSVGANVWVRSGRIEGAAPALASYDIESF